MMIIFLYLVNTEHPLIQFYLERGNLIRDLLVPLQPLPTFVSSRMLQPTLQFSKTVFVVRVIPLLIILQRCLSNFVLTHGLHFPIFSLNCCSFPTCPWMGRRHLDHFCFVSSLFRYIPYYWVCRLWDTCGYQHHAPRIVWLPSWPYYHLRDYSFGRDNKKHHVKAQHTLCGSVSRLVAVPDCFISDSNFKFLDCCIF